MRIMSPLLLAAALTTIGVQASAAPSVPLTSEEKLAKALEGRVAGKPVSCINTTQIRSSQIIDRTAIIYETSGGKLYVNRPNSGQAFLRRDNVLVTRNYTSQLCNVDIVRLYDSGMRMEVGSVGLGQFVPYTKVKAPAAS